MKKLIALLILLTTPMAYAAETEFSKLNTLPIKSVLDSYMDFDNKAEADSVIDNYIDGFVAGLIATYHYQSTIGENIRACTKVSGLSPQSLRKQMLKDARDPDMNTLHFGTYMYAVIHITCDIVLGEYITIEAAAKREKGTTS